jgi:hypothetical protein
VTNFWLKREARTTALGLSKRGFMYQGSVDRTLGNAATASAQFVTGAVPTVVYLREGTATADSVAFRLFEVSATSGASGSVRGQNLSRLVDGSASASDGVLWDTVTGASPTALLAYDVIPGGNRSGGTAICAKVRTLKPSTPYLLEFRNLGNNTTLIHATLVWSEGEPEPYDPLN